MQPSLITVKIRKPSTRQSTLDTTIILAPTISLSFQSHFSQTGPVCPRPRAQSSIKARGRKSARACAPPSTNKNISVHFFVRFYVIPSSDLALLPLRFPRPHPRTGKRRLGIHSSINHVEAGGQADGLVRPQRCAGRRLRPRRAGRARPHLPLRLHRGLSRHGRRGRSGAGCGDADGDAGGGGHSARAGGGGARHGGVPCLRRSPEPGGDGGDDGAGPHLGAPDGPVRGGAAAGVLPRLHPAPVPHRRHGHPGSCPGRRHQPHAGPGHGSDPHLLPPFCHICDDPRPAEPGPHHWSSAHRPHCRRQHPCWRQLLRRVHEPGQILRAGPGHWGLEPPLGLLGGPAPRWAPCWICLRVTVLGQQDA